MIDKIPKNTKTIPVKRVLSPEQLKQASLVIEGLSYTKVAQDNALVFATTLGYLNGHEINYIFERFLYVQSNFLSKANVEPLNQYFEERLKPINKSKKPELNQKKNKQINQ